MTISEQVQNDYKRWYHFLEQEVQFSLSFDNRVYLVMAFHDRDDVLGKAALTEQESGVLLYHIFKEDDVWIGANAVICGGVTIGKGAIIGAGSVVTRDIPSGVVAAGTPCRPLRPVTEADKIDLSTVSF